VLAAVVTRPKGASTALPALLELGIDRPTVSAKESAAHGYVGVFADLRRTAAGRAAFVPYQHDGEAAGRSSIGSPSSPGAMVGSRCTARVTAASPPGGGGAPAAGAQGHRGRGSDGAWNRHADVRRHLSEFSLPLVPRVTRSKAGVDPSFGDDAVWRALDEKWYRSGRRYRDLGTIYGRPNPIFIRWLNHPSYDRFWQAMIPYQRSFSASNSPCSR